MLNFTKPVNLNGEELITELKAAGIPVEGIPSLDADGVLWLEIPEEFKKKAEAVVAKHNGTTVFKEPTVDEKLASVGLDINDLKAALGL